MAPSDLGSRALLVGISGVAPSGYGPCAPRIKTSSGAPLDYHIGIAIRALGGKRVTPSDHGSRALRNQFWRMAPSVHESRALCWAPSDQGSRALRIGIWRLAPSDQGSLGMRIVLRRVVVPGAGRRGLMGLAFCASRSGAWGALGSALGAGAWRPRIMDPTLCSYRPGAGRLVAMDLSLREKRAAAGARRPRSWISRSANRH